jgi:peptide subunit release factor RF-3
MADDDRKPGKPLDLLSRITRQVPLGTVPVTFLIGRALACRR